MIEITVARRYAAAMLQIADKLNIVEEVEIALLNLKEAFEKDKDFKALMVNPRIPKSAKKKVTDRIFINRAHPAFIKFLHFLIDKNRFNLIAYIADQFDELAVACKGIVRVKAKTFMPVDEPQLAKLREKILGILPGAKLDIQVDIDKSLLGGIWIKLGDTLIDGSLVTKIKDMREKLYARASHVTGDKVKMEMGQA